MLPSGWLMAAKRWGGCQTVIVGLGREKVNYPRVAATARAMPATRCRPTVSALNYRV